MRRAQRLLLVLALGFALTLAGDTSVPALAVAAAVPVAPYDALTIYTGDGQHDTSTTPVEYKAGIVLDASNSTLTAQNSGRFFTVKNSLPASIAVSVAPPVGAEFVAGTTYPADQSATSSSLAYLSFHAPGSLCTTRVGSLTVHEITRDAVGDISMFAATWEQRCQNGTSVTRGEIRWHSTIGFAGVRTSGVPGPWSTAFPVMPAHATSAPLTVTYASGGSEPVVVRAPTLLGPDSGSFAITGSTCAGQTLAFADTCTVSVVARPQRTESQDAELVLGTDLPGDGLAIRLRVSATPNISGMYWPLTPSRILDTRIGLGVAKAPVGAGKTLRLQVGGAGLVAGYPEGVPAAGVGAVVLNLTATGATADTYLTTFPSFQPRPVASSLNLRKGTTVANMVTVRLSDLGSLDIYNGAGSTHVIADVIGYYTDDPSFDAPFGRGSAFHSVPARRLLDTRASAGVPTESWDGKVVTADFGPTVNRVITALAVNITATAPQQAGYLAAWDTNVAAKGTWTSTLNFTRGRTVSNMSLVPVSLSSTGLPAFKVFNASDGSVHLVVDVFGYYECGDQAGGLHFQPIQPKRIVDTRSGQGTTRLSAGTALITTPSALVGPGTRALVTNTTLVGPTKPTFLTLWPAMTGPRPGVSNLNAPPGQNVAAATVTGLGPNGRFNIFNMIGAAHALVDVAGTFEAYPAP